MKIGKFNLKEIKKYTEEEGLSDINQTMIIIIAKLVNEYLGQIEKEGVLVDFLTREGTKKKKNPLIDSILPSFNQIGKILKDNNLVLAKKAIDEQGDNFTDLMNRIITNEDERYNDVG